MVFLWEKTDQYHYRYLFSRSHNYVTLRTPLLIRNRFWIHTIHKARILRKKPIEKTFFNFKKWVKSIQTAGYNGALTVYCLWLEESQLTNSVTVCFLWFAKVYLSHRLWLGIKCENRQEENRMTTQRKLPIAYTGKSQRRRSMMWYHARKTASLIVSTVKAYCFPLSSLYFELSNYQGFFCRDKK